MPYDKIASKLMSMSDEVWRRHANPWSGWTRILTFPLWFLAFWSWTWIGWWCLAPIIVLSAWTWLNPRIFKPFSDDRQWITRAVLGEQLFIHRKNDPISKHHVRAAHWLTLFSGISAVGAIVGFITKEFYLALGGWILCVTFKLWFCDRMAWIYENMSVKLADPNKVEKKKKQNTLEQATPRKPSDLL